MNPFYRILYPLPEPKRVRKNPLRVLALGLTRSGTQSLCAALQTFGYEGTYEGFNITADGRDAVAWCRLASEKCPDGNWGNLPATRNPSPSFSAREFDKIVGDCEAVTELPAAAFGPELLHAYRDAKVILYRRADVDAWVKSYKTAICPLPHDWSYWIHSLFDAELFWARRSVKQIFLPYFGERDYDVGFDRRAKERYEAHYTRLESLEPSPGKFLRWTAEDGWEPLCRFLGKSVPDTPFPSGNTPPEFFATVARLERAKRWRARRNMGILACILIAFAMYYMQGVNAGH